MPQIQSSKKDLRRTAKRNVINERLRNRVKKAVKKFNEYIKEENIDKAKEVLTNTVKVLDKSAQKKVIKKGNASRKVSRLNKKLNKLITAKNVKASKKGS
ncbi:30S ribosomal protein S20 [Candidatus Dojkabacteria bacterium]|jgi:small subunit ribosomal protein S20|nr:30S ribosomal protein S20 [Candidatus Dojkabacteria bacterium]